LAEGAETGEVPEWEAEIRLGRRKMKEEERRGRRDVEWSS